MQQVNATDYAAISKATGLTVDRAKTFCDTLFGDDLPPLDETIAHVKAVKSLMDVNNIPLPAATKLYIESLQKKSKSSTKKGSVGDLISEDRAIAEKIALTRYQLIMEESSNLLGKFLTEGISESYEGSLLNPLSSSQTKLKDMVFEECSLGKWEWVKEALPDSQSLLELPPSSKSSISPGIG